METNGLMIGNWVCCKKYKEDPVPVFAVACESVLIDNGKSFIMVTSEDIQPIEITENLLLDNGFEKGESMYLDGVLCTSYNLQFDDTFIDITYGISNSIGRNWYCHIDNCDRQSIGSFDFQYVHEFQNGIRLITGNDLEIKI